MRIICLGDSNTYGYDPRSFWGDPIDMPWPGLLAEKTGYEVVNLGENGAEIPHNDMLIRYRDRAIRSHLPADLMIILLGTNDILVNYEEAELITAGRMDSYLSHLKETFPSLPLLLLAPMIMDRVDGFDASASRRLIPLYRRLSDRRGCYFADTNDFDLPLAYDNVHLTEIGHVRMAEELTEIVNTILPRAR